MREYRRVAGLPLNEDRTWVASEKTVSMVRVVVQVVAGISSVLAIGVEQFDADSTRTLAQLEQIQNPDDLAQLLRTDALTGFGNRRAMTELIHREIARSTRSKEPFSIAMLDIDHFKKINDTYGHNVGDQALIHLAKVAKSSIRETDEICRYGGEEFVVTLPGATAQGAYSVIDRMRGLVERTPLILKPSTIASVSISLRAICSMENIVKNSVELEVIDAIKIA